jgi:hypothetical protein
MTALLGGTPQSVALLEAGGTALSKWWATGIGAAAAASGPAVAAFWGGETPATHRMLIIALAVGFAAAVLAIGYIVGSDVRARSAAAVATINARAEVATTFARLAGDLGQAHSGAEDARVTGHANGDKVPVP